MKVVTLLENLFSYVAKSADTASGEHKRKLERLMRELMKLIDWLRDELPDFDTQEVGPPPPGGGPPPEEEGSP